MPERTHIAAIVLAKTIGAQLNFGVSREKTAKYPNGIPVHELVPV